MFISRVGLTIGVLASALSLGACSSDEPNGDGPATAEQASAYCQALVERETRCGVAPPADHCDRYVQCVQSLFRADVMSELTKCTHELECTASSDQCDSALSASNSGPTLGNFKTACRARQTQCEPELTSEGFFCFEDELGLLTDEAIEEFRACLSQSCDSIRGCMDSIAYRYRCKG